MKIVGIYGLRNKITNKWYVGQSVDVQGRWRAYDRLQCKNQRKLYHALVKYGVDAFEKSLFEVCEKVHWILDYREMYWIRVLNSVEDGYNLSTGGHAPRGWKHSEEWKRSNSEKMRNRVFTKDHRENISKGLLGRKLGELTKKKIGDCHRNNETFREKMRIVARNRPPMSAETREKCRQASLKKGPISEETREKLRQSALNRRNRLTSSGGI